MITNVKFKMEVNGGHQALVDDYRNEMARLLKLVRKYILEGAYDADLSDYNGNKCGWFNLHIEYEEDIDEDGIPNR